MKSWIADTMTDKDDDTQAAADQNRLQKIARGEPLTEVGEIAAGQVSSLEDGLSGDNLQADALKVARDALESPTTRMALELAKTQDNQRARQFALEAIRKMTEPTPGLVQSLAAIQPKGIDHAKLMRLGMITPSIDRAIAEAIKGIRPIQIDPALGRAIQDSQKALEKAMRPFGGAGSVIKHFEEQHQALRNSLVASLGGPLGDVAKTSQWASIIGGIKTPVIDATFGKALGKAVTDMQASIGRTFYGAVAADQAKMIAALGLTGRRGGDFETTRLKMSTLAGIGEVVEPRSNLHLDAYRSLFGEWRSRPDLPENFWRDSRVRKRMYREAEVDDGLIQATPGVALEIMVESGLTTGLRSETDAVAVITLGDVSMTVRSRGARRDAYAALERFEQEFRTYVSRKLEGKFGDDWFKERASNLVGKAKGIRKAAMERGEAYAPLVEFLELGELAGIVSSKKNWDEVFGDVFINLAEFDHDMQKLIATRRPTMHIRPIDGVRLVELLCVMQRLSDQMKDDGAWKIAAESDR